MAVTSIHPIKSTLVKALEYITDSQKTDEQLLVSGYLCDTDSSNAAKDFAAIRKLGTGRSSVLAQHLIQSFLPGETTPEQAHEIGMELAERYLRGQYQFVLATHVDKGHIHNHLIFNNTNYDNHRTFETNENRGKDTWKDLQQISDQICADHNLFIIPNPDLKKGKSWYEWQRDQNGESWKNKLKHRIDSAVMASNNFEEFLEELRKRNVEYSYQPHRKISLKFRLTDEGQERWTRAKTLGWYYEPEQLKKRIANYSAFIRGELDFSPKPKLIDTTAGRYAEAPGLQHWAMLRNMQEASKMINFLTAHGLTSVQDLESRTVLEFGRRMKLVADLNAIQQQIDTIADSISLIRKYRKLRPIYEQSFTATFRKKFEVDHKKELEEYARIESTMAKRFPDHVVPKLERLQQERDALIQQRNALNEEYKSCKREIQELEKARETIEQYLQVADPTREGSQKKETLE